MWKTMFAHDACLRSLKDGLRSRRTNRTLATESVWPQLKRKNTTVTCPYLELFGGVREKKGGICLPESGDQRL